MNLSFEVVAGAIGASFLVSITSLSGLFALWIEPERLKRIIPYLVALAVGVLLGDAFIHLIPDAVQRQGSIARDCLTVLLAMLLFFFWKNSVTSLCNRFMSPSIQPIDDTVLRADTRA